MNEFKTWMCHLWLVYDEELGAPEGIAAGTRWQDVPEGWLCPECQMGKDDFEMMEI